MNKVQIEKHKEVIGWFIDNADMGVWCRYENRTEWHFIFDPAFHVNCIYIPNDKYAEFRKALADGETIQINNTYNDSLVSGNWGDATDEPLWVLPPKHYRIKPTEPEFKAGDFVVLEYRDNGGTKITIEKITGEDKMVYYFDRKFHNRSTASKKRSTIKKWVPEEGDWCWFSNSELEIPVLKQFRGKNEKGDFLTFCFLEYNYCEPFFGVLPTNIF